LGHDLRNPLMSISAGAATLVRHPERVVETATLMQRSVSRMARLIDNVLDLARGRLGSGLPITCDADESVEPTLRQVVDELQSIHPDRVIEVAFALHEGVSCDRARIAQLLSNLLGNALTHGAPDVPIRIHATAMQGHFRLSVINGGEPIPQSALGRLFQPFFRGADRPSHEGLGLGLYIASEIARAHRGVLDVQSTPDETCFTLRMPTRSERPAVHRA
jgi:sigma-B regulation protein RsbU (phosphoserine phosphatase)